jgi:hypothetical protein
MFILIRTTLYRIYLLKFRFLLILNVFTSLLLAFYFACNFKAFLFKHFHTSNAIDPNILIVVLGAF